MNPLKDRRTLLLLLAGGGVALVAGAAIAFALMAPHRGERSAPAPASQAGLVIDSAGTSDETKLDPRLLTRFDYDEIFGTTLNRFCLQAVIGHPLTVYGAGGQTRGFLNIVDTLRCVELAASNPPLAGEYRVFNQFTESFTVLELAELVARAGKEVGLSVAIEHVDNPRVEAEEHYYNATHTRLLDLGLQPHYLSETLIESMFATIGSYRDRVVKDHILPRTRWRPRDTTPADATHL